MDIIKVLDTVTEHFGKDVKGMIDCLPDEEVKDMNNRSNIRTLMISMLTYFFMKDRYVLKRKIDGKDR